MNFRGYGFIEFDTIQAAHEAISSMNLFDLGGMFNFFFFEEKEFRISMI